MAHPVRQENFAAGEVAREFYGRTADPLYRRGLRTCKNFLPLPHGSLRSRPGTQFVAMAKDAVLAPRLIPFVFSDGQTFILEFGELFIRFYTDGGQVESSPGVPYELLSSPYAWADLPRLKFAQSGDVITLVHPGYAPQELTRISNTNWTLSAASYAADQVSDVLAGVFDFDGVPLAVAPDAAHPVKEWKWCFTVADGVALTGESQIVATLTPPTGSVVLFDDYPVKLKWTGAIHAYRYYNVYRGRNGLFGYVGTVDLDVGGYSFKDDGQEPNYSIRPPSGDRSFNAPDDFPGAVAYHDQRLLLARTNGNPSIFYGSELANYRHFEEQPDLATIIVKADDPFRWKIASRYLEEIRSILSRQDDALLFTGMGVFAASGGGNGEVLSATAVNVRRASSHGTSWLDPLEAGDNLTGAVLYNTAKQNRIRELFFDYNARGWGGRDLTVIGRHLFDRHTIADWAYAAEPYGIVWVVRDDGVLLSLTYDRAREVLAWAQHSSGPAATFKSVAVVPEGNEDAVYFVVQRTGTGATFYIERLSSPSLPTLASWVVVETDGGDYVEAVELEDLRFAVQVDCSLTFDGRNKTATTLQFSSAGGISALTQRVVTASAPTFAASDVGDALVFPDDARHGSDGYTEYRARVIDYTDPTHVTVEFDSDMPLETAVLWAIGFDTGWGWARRSFDLSHLANRTATSVDPKGVVALADGAPAEATWDTATFRLTLNIPAMIVTAGIPYDCDAELLDVDLTAIRGDTKTVGQAIVEVVASRRFKAGETFDTLKPAKVAVDDTAVPPELVTDQVEIKIGSSWNVGGRVCIRQSDPVPLTITSVTRMVEVGGPQ